MADENWQKVREIFDSALRRKPEERQNYIIEVCGEDKTLLTEVESLLSSLDGAESFMETPAVAKVASVIDAEAKKLERGKCFGHYEIIEQIGAGGMGKVYLAEDKKLDRKVAVKILNEKFSLDESNLNRFIREAKAASALNHPNILVIHEIGEAEDTHYIVSEFIKGKTLRDFLKQSSLKLSEILDISIQIANALCTAHEARLVHRDIKPENIMIRPDGFVKILDFGLAKLVEQKPIGLEEITVKQNETAKGLILGTVNYMSPEQVKGERVDERTDIFSFGTVIYEMIAGKTPFAGDSISETIANLLKAEPPPIERFASDVPAELQRVILKMLRKDKTERFQTMKELSADLKNLRENLSLEEKLERPTLPGDENATAILQATTGDTTKQTAETQNSFSLTVKRHKSLAEFALAALLVGAVGLGYYFFNRSKTPLVFQAGQTTRLTSSGRVKAAAVTPDGKFIIYAQEENNEQQSLWVQHLGSQSNVQIAPPADIDFRSLNITPDSNTLYYHDANGTLFKMPVLGGTPKKVADKLLSNQAFGNEKIGISPDSKQIAFVRKFEHYATKMFIADADGSNERMLASFEQPTILQQVTAWSPDGKVISGLLVNKGMQNVLAIQVTDATFAPIVVKRWANILNLSWMPDSKSLITEAGIDDYDYYHIWQIGYPSRELRQITSDSKDYYKINVTADGSFLTAVRTEQNSQIWMMPANDVSRARQLTAGFEKYEGTFCLGWMPDGKLVYDSVSSGKMSGWSIEADGKNPSQLINDALLYAASPNGRYLVYKKTASLWRTDLKDGSEKQLMNGIWATFSPDGKWIVYTAYNERVTISRVSVDGGEPKLIYGGIIGGINPKVSPDGKTVAFTVFGKINLVAFEGGEIIKTFDTRPERIENINKQNLQWTPDGRGIYFIALNDGVSNIWRQPIDGSPPVQVTKFETGRIFNFAYSPDGKQLALSRGSLNSDVVLIKNSQ